MPRIRKFNKNSEKEKVFILMRCMLSAMMEHPEFSNVGEHRTDLIGIACQYNKSVRRSDFDLIKNLAVEDIINLFSEGWK